MKKREKAVYTRRINIRLKEAEYNQLETQCKKTTCRKLSEYVRNLIFSRPVTIKYRNATADDFLQEAIQLKKELSAIGNNYNQVVRRLHTLSHIQEVKIWLLLHESYPKSITKKTDEIIEKLNQIYQQWSQE